MMICVFIPSELHRAQIKSEGSLSEQCIIILYNSKIEKETRRDSRRIEDETITKKDILRGGKLKENPRFVNDKASMRPSMTYMGRALGPNQKPQASKVL